MKILVPITDFERRQVERGRGVGNIISQRYLVAGDNWCWNIAIEREGSNPIGEQFYPSMRVLLPAIGRRFPDNILDIVGRIIRALKDNTGIEYTYSFPKIGGEKDLEMIGKNLDDVFGTSYNRGVFPPTVMKRIFKAEEPEDAELVEA